MKRPLILIVLLFIVMLPQVCQATLYPGQQTMWNNFTDSIHTIGQTPQQAKATQMRLHYLRFKARQKAIQQAQNHR